MSSIAITEQGTAWHGHVWRKPYTERPLLIAFNIPYSDRPGIYGPEATAEMDACDQDKLHDALYDLCFDERHPDDFSNLGNYDNYTSLTREEQLAVLEAARK